MVHSVIYCVIVPELCIQGLSRHSIVLGMQARTRMELAHGAVGVGSSILKKYYDSYFHDLIYEYRRRCRNIPILLACEVHGIPRSSALVVTARVLRRTITYRYSVTSCYIRWHGNISSFGPAYPPLVPRSTGGVTQ